MTSTPSYSRNDIVLVRYPFSDLSSAKVRPAVVVNAPHSSHHPTLIAKLVGRLTEFDAARLERSLRDWLSLPFYLVLPPDQAWASNHRRMSGMHRLGKMWRVGTKRCSTEEARCSRAALNPLTRSRR